MNGESIRFINADEGLTNTRVALAGATALITGIGLGVIYRVGLEGNDVSLRTTPRVHAIEQTLPEEPAPTVPSPRNTTPKPSISPSSIDVIAPSPTPSVTETPTPEAEVAESPSPTTAQLQTPQPKIEAKPRTVWEETYAVSPETAEVESALLHTAETIVNELVTSKTDRVVGEGGVLISADIKSESYDELAKKALELIASDATLSLAVSEGWLEIGYSNAAGEQASVAFVSEAGTVPPSDRTALADWLKQSSITNVCSMVPELVDPTIVERLDDEDTNLNPMNAPGTFKGACYAVDQDGNWQESAMALMPDQSLLGATTEETIIAADNSINKMFPEIPAAEKLIEEGIK